MSDPPVTQTAGTVTIRTAPMLAATYRAVLLGIRQRRHDGLPSGDLQQLARASFRAHGEAVKALGGKTIDREKIKALGPHGTNQHTRGESGTLSKRRDATTILARLKRDDPELADAVMSPPRHRSDTDHPNPACSNGQGLSDWCSVGEASALLGISRRQVQRMAAERGRELDAIRVGRTWALRKAPVLALAQRRKATR